MNDGLLGCGLSCGLGRYLADLAELPSLAVWCRCKYTCRQMVATEGKAICNEYVFILCLSNPRTSLETNWMHSKCPPMVVISFHDLNQWEA